MDQVTERLSEKRTADCRSELSGSLVSTSRGRYGFVRGVNRNSRGGTRATDRGSRAPWIASFLDLAVALEPLTEEAEPLGLRVSSIKLKV